MRVCSLFYCDHRIDRTNANFCVIIAEAVSSESSAMISISGLINRSDDEALACKVPDVNKVLKECCKQKNWGFVDHSNISITSHLNRSGLHLNKKGTTRLAQNFINHLRVD